MKEKKLKKQNNSCQQPTTKNQTQSGITLVALVITVIILLILAGVAISMITGEDGLFAKANNAATKYNQAAQNESVVFNNLLNELDIIMNPPKPLAEVAKIGDFVNYSVEVDGVVYDKWRILHFDTNGYVEIVCYNGPNFTLYSISPTNGFGPAIQALNEQSIAYGNGTYGVSTRHLGSNPSNPSSYASIDTSNLSGTSVSSTNYTQTHHLTDTEQLISFQGEKILFADNTWLASRNSYPLSNFNRYAVRIFNSTEAKVGDWALYDLVPWSHANQGSGNLAIAPVVSLEQGIMVKIINTDGDGSIDNPWELTKK